MVRRALFTSPALFACCLASCATSPERAEMLAAEEASRIAEIELRQGESVTRVCPRGNDGWEALGDDVLLLEAGDDWFMAELSGTCDPESTFGGIATRSSTGSSCIARGDNVFTGRPRSGGRCMITGLYAWDKEAVTDAPDAEAGSSSD